MSNARTAKEALIEALFEDADRIIHRIESLGGSVGASAEKIDASLVEIVASVESLKKTVLEARGHGFPADVAAEIAHHIKNNADADKIADQVEAAIRQKFTKEVYTEFLLNLSKEAASRVTSEVIAQTKNEMNDFKESFKREFKVDFHDHASASSEALKIAKRTIAELEQTVKKLSSELTTKREEKGIFQPVVISLCTSVFVIIIMSFLKMY